MTTLRSELPEWNALAAHAADLKTQHIREFFGADPERFHNFHLKYDGLLFDFSKNLITGETLEMLRDLTRVCDLEGWREQMFSGKPINITDERPVLHCGIRKQPASADILRERERLFAFCNRIVDEGKYKHVVNLGIGGSHLGLQMAYKALKPYQNDLKVHFVANIDGSRLLEVFEEIIPEETLFVVVSKSFGTRETLMNATTARAWMQEQGLEDISKHFVAVSSHVDRAKAFGIDEDSIFPIPDGVGGRFSLWSNVGLSLCLGVGPKHFQALLDGAFSMDAHFQEAPFHENIPMLLALIGIWNRNFLKHASLGIIPYTQRLSMLESYMQQLDMESNGKSVDRQGRFLPYETGPFIFGETGTNAQHAFFQLIHQGTEIIPCDFIVIKDPKHPLDEHHHVLLANALAQPQALMQGQDHDDPNHVFTGNRPSNTLVLDVLTPYSLGLLLALYEHKVFVQGIIWNINSFDQCGVELGKTLATAIENQSKSLDSSTQGLLEHLDLFHD